MKLKQSLNELIDCHKGTINRVVHLIGFILMGLGILEKSIFLLVLGAALQEVGHFYEYWRTGDPKSSPLYCFRSQIIFWIIFILIIIYILLIK